jgi:hypothetical protein
MAEPKDKKLRELRRARRKELRIAKRAHKRGNIKAYRRHRERAQGLLHAIRARRKSLRYRLKIPAKSGTTYFAGFQVANWIAPILAAAKATGKWDGRLSSGYRSYAKQYWIYFIARIRPAAYPGTSNHEGSTYPKGAIDTPSPYGLEAALRSIGRYGIGPGKLYGYNDAIGSNDPWHFSATGR